MNRRSLLSASSDPAGRMVAAGETMGQSDLRYLELFNSAYYPDVSLAIWMAETPHELVAQHLSVSEDFLDRLPGQKHPVVPA